MDRCFSLFHFLLTLGGREFYEILPGVARGNFASKTDENFLFFQKAWKTPDVKKVQGSFALSLFFVVIH